MSYYANADGAINLKRELTDSEIDDVREILDYYDSFIKGEQITLYRSQKNYNEDYAKNNLITLVDYLNERENSIDSASIEWNGEDGAIWRFVFEDNEWAEQNGYIEWGDSTQFQSSSPKNIC